MKLLALETADRHCSVALCNGGWLEQRLERDARRHAEHLLPMIHDLLDEASLTLAELDGIVVDAGPGSFTGIRTGISMAQGFGLALGLQLYPVCSLAALGQAARASGLPAPVLAVQDARMGEVYWALVGESGHLLTPPALHSPATLPLDTLPHPPAAAVGTGLALIQDRLKATVPQALPAPEPFLQARWLLPLAQEIQPVTATELHPLYVRNQVADERARVQPSPDVSPP